MQNVEIYRSRSPDSYREIDVIAAVRVSCGGGEHCIVHVHETERKIAAHAKSAAVV